MSLIRTVKDSRAAQHFLIHQCRAALDQARSLSDTERITTARSFYGLDRRVREYLEDGTSWGLEDDPNSLQRESFVTLQNMYDYLIRNTTGEERRAHNRRLNRLEYLAKWPVLRSYPIRSYFDTTNRCNLRCPMCAQSFLVGRRPDQPREAVEWAKPIFDYMDHMSIFGWGEALLVDYIGDLLDAIPPHVNSWLVTNGLLLTPKNNRMLIERGLKSLFISIDSTTRETYEFVRGVDGFDRVVRNIEDLQSRKRALGFETPELTLTFVAMRRTIDELPEFVRMARRLGIGKVIADYLTVISGDMREQSLYYHQDHSDRMVAEADRVAREEGVELVAPIAFSTPAKRAVRKERCVEPWEFVYWRPDGFVQPCCLNTDLLDRWHSKNFEEYWNSPGYQELRRNIYTNKESDFCKDCSHVCYRDNHLETAHIQIHPDQPPERAMAADSLKLGAMI